MNRAEFVATLLLVVGLVLVPAGIWMLAGTGWCLLVAGAECVVTGTVIAKALVDAGA